MDRKTKNLLTELRDSLDSSLQAVDKLLGPEEEVADGSVTITNNPDAKIRPGVNPGPRTDVLKE